MTQVVYSTESRNSFFGSHNRVRKYSKCNSLPIFRLLRMCIKTPSALVDIYKDSQGLRSLLRWLFAVSSSIFILCAIPLSFYPPRSAIQKTLNLKRTYDEIMIGWAALVAIHPLYVFVVSCVVGFSLAREYHQTEIMQRDKALPTVSESIKSIPVYPQRQTNFTIALEMARQPSMKKNLRTLGAALAIAAVIGIQCHVQWTHPSWIWNPFLFRYNVYWPSEISSEMDGICIEDVNVDKYFANGQRILKKGEDPLCLSEQSWRKLSTDVLSSFNEEDVRNVLNGVRYLTNESGGIVFGVTARDTINAIASLRLNIESLLPFTTNLAVVVFENDSEDGSRQAFLDWSEDVHGRYTVDVMECEDSPGCKFNESHRDSKNDIPYAETSAVGKMDKYRQRVVDHILNDAKFIDYSHMLVYDIDLSVSISPLGILHSLGIKPSDAIACSGRQARPGSFGSLQPPYDFSAFVSHESDWNKRLIALNTKFCNLSSEGHRWRNECTCVSVAQFIMIQIEDKLNDGKPYIVDSAFNGAVLYPVKLVRQSEAKYDAGKDGQRCEHVGFNLSMQQPMYINPKWNMHLHPEVIGGPSGQRAARAIMNTSPKVMLFILGQNILSVVIFTYCVTTLTMLIIYPLIYI